MLERKISENKNKIGLSVPNNYTSGSLTYECLAFLETLSTCQLNLIHTSAWF